MLNQSQTLIILGDVSFVSEEMIYRIFILRGIRLRIDINKYWIGFLTGFIISINIFSGGVILSKTLSLNWIYFFWIWVITTPILLTIKYLHTKQKKEVKREKWD